MEKSNPALAAFENLKMRKGGMEEKEGYASMTGSFDSPLLHQKQPPSYKSLHPLTDVVQALSTSSSPFTFLPPPKPSQVLNFSAKGKGTVLFPHFSLSFHIMLLC
jgi:hypothetical protein